MFNSKYRIDPIGAWLVKWFFWPILIAYIVIWLGHFGFMVYKGKQLCKAKGYMESTYLIGNRFGYGSKYVFYKKINPDGTIDEDARLVVELH